MRNGLRALLATAVAVLGLTAPAIVGVADAAPTAATGPAAVKLLSAGMQPRATLRLHVPDGTAAQATMEMSESIEQKLAGSSPKSVTTPPVRVGMKVEAGSARAGGELPITYGYSDVTVVPDGSFTAEQVAQYQRALQPLTALSATATLTPRNQIVDSKLSGTEHLDASLGQVVSQLSDQLGAISSPFPKEPVGTGARWRTTSRIHVSGIDATQVSQYTLRSIDGDRVTMDVELTQTAPRQRAELPGVPAGTTVTLTHWRAADGGQVTLDLAIPGLPAASAMHSSGTQTFLVSKGGQRTSLDQKVAIDMKVSQ